MKHLAAVLAAFCFLFASAGPVRADEVTPSTRVQSGVVIRAAPDTQAAALGLLRPGERLPLLGSVPRWNQVALPGGRSGYVSKAWTTVVPAPGDAASAAPAFAVHFVDVGTGLAAFIEGPGFTAVYDGGSNDDTARGDRNRLLAYLRQLRPDLQTIDHLILSHPHRDHVELLPDLFAAYQVRHVWDSGRTHPICGYRAFIEAVIAEPGVNYHDAVGHFSRRRAAFPAQRCYGRDLPAADLLVTEHARITADPVALAPSASMRFLHADGSDHGSPNENSLVVLFQLGQVRMLFMGDAEAGGRQPPATAPAANSIEGRLLSCCSDELGADVLVAGHHGSTTSSRTAFLDAVGARHAIVSAGPTRYGSVVLPDRAVLNALAARGSVWRTDVDDTACRASSAKIGSDNDNEPGGCDNIHVEISGTTLIVRHRRVAD